MRRGQYPVVGGLLPELLARALIAFSRIFGWPKSSGTDNSWQFVDQTLSDMQNLDQGITLESLAALSEEEGEMMERTG